MRQYPKIKPQHRNIDISAKLLIFLLKMAKKNAACEAGTNREQCDAAAIKIIVVRVELLLVYSIFPLVIVLLAGCSPAEPASSSDDNAKIMSILIINKV